MIQTIPITGAQIPDESFSVNINGTQYAFRIQYNQRYDFWYMSISANSVLLCSNVTLVQGVALTKPYDIDFDNAPVQTGILKIISISNDIADPTLNDLGTDKFLVYATYPDNNFNPPIFEITPV